MSQTENMKITEFLEARIAEDETEALDAPKMRDVYDASRKAFTAAMRKKVLAECVMKRYLVARLSGVASNDDPYYRSLREWAVEGLCAIATVYSDHADYRQEWAL